MTKNLLFKPLRLIFATVPFIFRNRYEIFKPLVTEHMDEINTSFENMILDAMLKHGDLGVKTVQQFIEEADKDMSLILNNTTVELAKKLKSFVDDIA